MATTPETVAKDMPVSSSMSAPRRIWRNIRRFWCIPTSFRLFTPGFAGIFLLTAICAGLTATAYALLRLLPNRQVISELLTELPHGILGVISRLSELLSTAVPSTQMVTGALVAPEAYIMVYALGTATVFCLLLLLIAFVRRW